MLHFALVENVIDESHRPERFHHAFFAQLGLADGTSDQLRLCIFVAVLTEQA